MNHKERLLYLISQRDEMCTEPIKDRFLIFEWLEEILFLSKQINIPTLMLPKIISVIEDVHFNNDEVDFLDKNIWEIKAKLSVFEKYEAHKLKDS